MTTKLLRPSTLRPLLSPPSHLPLSARRTFLTTTPADLTASRTLQYPALAIYDIIADISSYPSFLPYCRSANVTSLSKPDAHYQRQWPQRATLTIGYGDSITESFTSRVYCVPPVSEEGRAGMGYVEAVSGKAESKMEREFVAHHDEAEAAGRKGEEEAGSGPMEYLRTRWTVRAYPFKPAAEEGKAEGKDLSARERCDVSLNIQYKFANPAYDLMSRAVAPKMADVMVEAFEKRVHALLGGKS